MPSEAKVKTERVKCVNERYLHAQIGMVGLLIKSESAKRDEDENEELQLVMS